MPQEVTNLANLVLTLRNILVFLGGPIVALYMTIGGIKIATARGAPRSYQEGMDTLQNAGLGLIIILFAALITTIIGKALRGDFTLPTGALPGVFF